MANRRLTQAIKAIARAEVALEQNAWAQALDEVRTATDYFGLAENDEYLGETLSVQGEILCLLNRPEEAAESFERALEFEAHLPPDTARTLRDRVNVLKAYVRREKD